MVAAGRREEGLYEPVHHDTWMQGVLKWVQQVQQMAMRLPSQTRTIAPSCA